MLLSAHSGDDTVDAPGYDLLVSDTERKKSPSHLRRWADPVVLAIPCGEPELIKFDPTDIDAVGQCKNCIALTARFVDGCSRWTTPVGHYKASELGG